MLGGTDTAAYVIGERPACRDGIIRNAARPASSERERKSAFLESFSRKYRKLLLRINNSIFFPHVQNSREKPPASAFSPKHGISPLGDVPPLKQGDQIQSDANGFGGMKINVNILRYGWRDGRQCLLRTICELAETPLGRRSRQDVLEEMIHLILT